jgi:hypothetical protein
MILSIESVVVASARHPWRALDIYGNDVNHALLALSAPELPSAAERTVCLIVMPATISNGTT